MTSFIRKILAKSLPLVRLRTVISNHQPRKHEGKYFGIADNPSVWLKELRSSYRLFPSPSSQALANIINDSPNQIEATILAAERVMRHEFNLLGSGPFHPVDENRSIKNGYSPIDWNLDPVSGLRFPSRVHHKDWDLWKMRPGTADIKLPWELARCQHWVTLSQAWLLTGNVKFAEEIFAERSDFDNANPPGIGIHWTCTMDVAIRAANWALALEMIRSYPAPESEWDAAYASLFQHGRFIRSNLEDKYEVTSNHFLSNVIGLFYLARVFQQSEEASEWEEFSRNAIEREMQVQVLPDGADFESSVPYHRLVAELFLGAVKVADQSGRPFSEHLRAKLVDMINFLDGVLRPDGLMPQLGDADDGRLHIFTDFGSWNPQDARHLLASASHVLGVSEWRRHCGEKGQWEAFWWSGGEDINGFRKEIFHPFEGYFPEAGIAVHRSNQAYLVIINGIVGTNGFGNHKHNDLLSFEYHPDLVPLIVDPGSYVYTSDVVARNMFRSTAYHNTVMVDGYEQNETNPEWIFRLFEKAHPETLEYQVTNDTFLYRGRHIGYTRLENPVIHERSFRLDRNNGELSVVDHFEGNGAHILNWHFHLAPNIEVSLEAGRILFFQKSTENIWQLTIHERITVRITPAWYSPSYGKRFSCKAVDLMVEAVLPSDDSWDFTFSRLAN